MGIFCLGFPPSRRSSRSLNFEGKLTQKEMSAPGTHLLLKNSIFGPFPENSKQIVLGMGCFWCSENLFMRWGSRGVISTHVGYAGGQKENPKYSEVCGAKTGHAEVTRVVFDPSKLSVTEILKVFWEKHDPTQPNRQGNDRGPQYRSAIYTSDPEIYAEAIRTKNVYEKAIGKKIVTEILDHEPKFWYGEDEHQQYDVRPGSRDYCGLHPLNIPYPADDNCEKPGA